MKSVTFEGELNLVGNEGVFEVEGTEKALESLLGVTVINEFHNCVRRSRPLLKVTFELVES